MYRITFVLDLFKGEDERKLSHDSLKSLLLALMHLDCLYLREHPEVPLLFDSGVRYQEEPPGQEDWQDIPTTLKLKIGDCLPLSTLVLRANGEACEIGSLVPGDVIMGDGVPTRVIETAVTGEKDILAFDLDNGCTLRCSPEHKLFLQSGEEVRAKNVRVGDRLKSPSSPFPCAETAWQTRAKNSANSTKVRAIRECEPEMCCDIETDTGKFYLPESDVVVHNCEDLACWRAAELRVRHNIMAEPTFIWKKRENGGYLYHILVRLPDGRVEDPSRTLGMR